jgi:hypothetical protein
MVASRSGGVTGGRKTRMIPDVFAVMTVDPGRATGVSQGAFRASGDPATVEATLRRAVRKGAVRASVLDGPACEQAHYIARFWRDFRFRMTVEWGVPGAALFLVVEDFQLRQMAVDLAPVEVFAALRAVQRVPVTDGWFDDVSAGQLVRPSASEARTFGTDTRMREWGVYEIGMKADRRGGPRMVGDHARAALSHLCLGVNKCLEGKWPDDKRDLGPVGPLVKTPVMFAGID